MWKLPWNREEWVISRTGFRVLTLIFWGETALLLVFLYLAVLALAGKPEFPENLPLRILLSLVGAVGAFSSLMLDSAMKVFGDNQRRTGERTTNVWRLGWILPVFGPQLLYFLLVYRPKMRELGFLRE